MKTKQSFDKRQFLNTLLIGSVATFALRYTLFYRHAAMRGFSDGCFTISVILLSFGLFRFAASLHLFDIVPYSFARMKALRRRKRNNGATDTVSSDEYTDYAAYTAAHPYTKQFIVYILAGGIFLLISGMLTLFI